MTSPAGSPPGGARTGTPAVSDWRETIPGAKKGRRSRRYGWWVLLAIVLALTLYAIFPWRAFMGFTTVTVDTYSCTQPIPAEPVVDPVNALGCTPGVPDGVRVDVSFGLDLLDEDRTVEGSSITIGDVPVESPDLNFLVTTPPGTQGVLSADASVSPLEPMRALNASDVLGSRWVGHLDPGASTQLAVLVGPVSAP